MLVFFDIGVHEVEGNSTEIHAPDNDENIQAADIEFDEKPPFMIWARRFDGGFVAIQQLVNVFLPSIRLDSLMEVALWIYKSDTYKWYAQVT